MASLRAHEGELLIDHSASPGIPADLTAAWQAAGKIVEAVPAGMRFESAVQTCSHCQAVIVMHPLRTRARGYCSRCDHYICDNPICHRECQPILATLDRAERLGGLVMP